MILLLGGTSDAQPLARRLAESGYHVLISQATQVPLLPPLPPGEGRGEGNLPQTQRPLRLGIVEEATVASDVGRIGNPSVNEAGHQDGLAIRPTGKRTLVHPPIPGGYKDAMGVAGSSAIPPHPNPLPEGEGESRIQTRAGALDAAAMAALVDARKIRAIVDAGHPYADKLHATARAVAQQCQVPYLAFVRPGSVQFDMEGVRVVADHATAAREAFQCGRPVLLTIGSKNLAEYVEQSRRTGLALVARVLDWPASIAACRRAGIEPWQIFADRGPFSVAQNRRQIRAFRIGVIVTKDSGRAGGTPEKLEAARLEHCQVIVVRRPAWTGDNLFSDLEPLLEAIGRLVPVRPPSPSGRGLG